MYRALALKAIMNDVSFDESAPLLKLAENSKIELQPRMDGNRVLLDTEDVSRRIRERDVTEGASRVSLHPAVREWMVARQRELGVNGGVIMEGRDIGTVVFPNAELKIFLDADPKVRAERRIEQVQAKDPDAAKALAEELKRRDQRDSTRTASPLAPAADAVVLDSSKLGVEEVLAQIEELILERTAAAKRS
jgi:cytidylate kinase